MIEPGDGTGCRALWVAVLAIALQDAQGTAGGIEQARADRWLRAGNDMLTVTALAGLDGRLVRDRYCAGLVDSGLLHGQRQVQHGGHVRGRRKAA